jgi:hypothetical protein
MPTTTLPNFKLPTLKVPTLFCLVAYGVAEKHDFRGIQQKIPQKSDFSQNQDLNPVPHGNTAADIAKIFERNLQRKSESAKNDFRGFSAACQFYYFSLL